MKKLELDSSWIPGVKPIIHNVLDFQTVRRKLFILMQAAWHG